MTCVRSRWVFRHILNSDWLKLAKQDESVRCVFEPILTLYWRGVFPFELLLSYARPLLSWYCIQLDCIPWSSHVRMNEHAFNMMVYCVISARKWTCPACAGVCLCPRHKVRLACDCADLMCAYKVYFAFLEVNRASKLTMNLLCPALKSHERINGAFFKVLAPLLCLMFSSKFSDEIVLLAFVCGAKERASSKLIRIIRDKTISH